jgi:polyisoprenyl-phosphate glycosyltransferase
MAMISIIVPCYYNGKNLPVTIPQLIENEKQYPEGTQIEYVFVDDGSKDETYDQLVSFWNLYPDKITVLKLAGNVGSHSAVLAGMDYCRGDCCVILAADLQDPPELIPRMFNYWNQGIKLVIANRQDRQEPFLQKILSGIYHSIIKKFAIANIPPGGFDLVLFDKQIKEELLAIKERNTNILYLMSWMNFDYINIPYVRRKREIGKSKWTFRKKLKLFVDSFVAFSYFPIRLITFVGLILGVLAFIYAGFIVYSKLTGKINNDGWSSLMTVILFVSAFQMIAMGILGEYVWRTLDASRKRPNYVIDQLLRNTDKA